MDYLFAYAALISYVLFIIAAIVLRIGSGDAPLGSINKLHARIASLYITGSALLVYFFEPFTADTAVKFLIGLLSYFLIHYSVFLNFFALAQRSISSMLLLLYEEATIRTEREFTEKYAQGRGLRHVKESRLSDLKSLGWIVESNNTYHLTSKGRTVCRIISLFLLCWGLKQLGERDD